MRFLIFTTLLCLLALPAKAQQPPTVNLANEMNSQVLNEMRDAWLLSGSGRSHNESVVLIYRKVNGTLFAIRQGVSRQPLSASFVYTAAVLAVIHTHPNSCSPVPSKTDKETAHKLLLPIFTITSRGMYVYDPLTEQTEEVKKGLEWYDRASWTRK